MPVGAVPRITVSHEILSPTHHLLSLLEQLKPDLSWDGTCRMLLLDASYDKADLLRVAREAALQKQGAVTPDMITARLSSVLMPGFERCLECGGKSYALIFFNSPFRHPMVSLPVARPRHAAQV